MSTAGGTVGTAINSVAAAVSDASAVDIVISAGNSIVATISSFDSVGFYENDDFIIYQILFLFIISLFITIFICKYSHRYIENYFISIGNKIINKLKNKTIKHY